MKLLSWFEKGLSIAIFSSFIRDLMSVDVHIINFLLFLLLLFIIIQTSPALPRTDLAIYHL